MVPNVTPVYLIQQARPGDLAQLNAIELAAARLLVGYAPERVLEEATPLADFEDAQRNGLLWVASTADAPVGFAHVIMLGPNAVHLDELDVHPAHGRRGLGTRLVEAVCTWAASHGHPGVTLCTFRDVPWNMPFYARLGFDVVTGNSISPALQAVVDDESRRGLDPSKRVVMQWLSPSVRSARLDENVSRKPKHRTERIR